MPWLKPLVHLLVFHENAALDQSLPQGLKLLPNLHNVAEGKSLGACVSRFLALRSIYGASYFQASLEIQHEFCPVPTNALQTHGHVQQEM
jgi:hypothetical protein